MTYENPTEDEVKAIYGMDVMVKMGTMAMSLKQAYQVEGLACQPKNPEARFDAAKRVSKLLESIHNADPGRLIQEHHHLLPNQQG